MDFLKHISVSKLNNVVLRLPLQEPIEGILYITGHHFIVSSRKEKIQEVWILHQSVDHIEKKTISNASGGTLIIKCKDLRILFLDIDNSEHLHNVYSTIDKLSNISNLLLLYPFFYRPMYNILEDGYLLYRMEIEFAKLLATDDWRISDINRNFKICPSYGKILIVPKYIEDDILAKSARFRDHGRFPVVSYRHDNGRVLIRSSQPLQGSNNNRCSADEILLNSMLGIDFKGYIIDTRSLSLANQSKSKGGGYEMESFYPRWRRIHKPLDKITNGNGHLLESFTKLMEACNDTNCSMDKWLTRLDNSNWLSNVLISLNCACVVAQCIDQEQMTCLVHGSNGFDTTILITSLTQVILNPDCRTIRGFQALIEREWLQGGYPFSLRHVKSCYATNGRTKAHQPTFLLFLDCVYQLNYQFSCSFEFTTNFLIQLFEHSYFSQFGTFLGNNELDRRNMKVYKTTTSLWSYLNHPDVLETLLNPLYEPNLGAIWPSVAPISLVLWRELYLRWIIDQSSFNTQIVKIQKIQERNKNLRTLALKYRKQLIQLHQEYQFHQKKFNF